VRRHVLLDTSAYSAFKRGHERIGRTLQEAEEIYLASIAIGELLAGFRGGSREKHNRDALKTFLSSPRVTLLDVDEEAAERYGIIQHDLRVAGTPIPTNDIWISAVAMRDGLAVVTTDPHYTKIPHIVVDLHEIS
jgi:tRNA(fMet)-specific endonuclease VapC